MKTVQRKISVMACLMTFITFCLLCESASPAFAQQLATEPQVASSQAGVPPLIRFTGTAQDINGNPQTGLVGITFAIYAEASGGSPLWLETQNVQADKNGHYTALLGATKPSGLPMELFSSGESRWLGVQTEGQAEQTRALLVAVPYALKASDAETVGGLPASAFVLANPAQSASSTNKTGEAASASPASTPNAEASKNSIPPANPSVTGKGVVDYIPMWDTTSDIIDSVIFQKTSEIGIGTTAPAATLDVNGKSDIRDTLTLFPKSTDSTLAVNGTTFKVSQTGEVTFITGQTFPGTGTITGITTATGSGLSGGGTKGILNLKVPAAGITNAMLADSKITLNASTAGGLTVPGAMTLGDTYTIGLKTCAANQILEYSGTAWNCSSLSSGTGTITGVTAGTDLTGGGSSGSVTLNVDSTKVPQLKTANTFTGNQSVTGNVSATGQFVSTVTTGTAPLSVNSTTQVSNLNASLLGGFPASSFARSSGGTEFTGEVDIEFIQSNLAPILNVDNLSGQGSTFGISGRNTGPSGAGILGFNSQFSNTGLTFYNNLSINSFGIWADNSNTTTSERGALLATADDASAIVVDNNSSSYPAIAVTVTGSGPGISIGGFGTPLVWNYTGPSLSNDQGGSIELGANNTIANVKGATPYIDFHYGVDGTTAQDFNVRVVNDANGQLTLKGAPSTSTVLNVQGLVNATTGFSGRCLQSDTFESSVLNSCNMDLAEAYKSTQATEPGDLVSLVPEAEATVRKSVGRYETLLLGVVSSNPGLVFDNGQTHLAGNNSQLITKDKTVIALAGRVPVKISMENGPIQVGDPLTSSSKSGVAMKAKSAGKIIGYALEPANKPGKVLSFIQPGYYAAPEMERLQRENLALRKELKDLAAQVKTIRTELTHTQFSADLHTAATSSKPLN